jgi:hypothetical protein
MAWYGPLLVGGSRTESVAWMGRVVKLINRWRGMRCQSDQRGEKERERKKERKKERERGGNFMDSAFLVLLGVSEKVALSLSLNSAKRDRKLLVRQTKS